MSAALSVFRDSLKSVEEIPYCTGTITLQKSNSTLFYKSDDSSAKFVDFMNPTNAQLDDLAAACQVATFGREQEDVLDESYRKAGKMDVGTFAIPFNIDHTGILDSLRKSLLCSSAKDDVHFELYKLNVYGPGDFFKAHVDTPRGDTMFGSLVVILPTKHEGGSLVFRHHGEEWTFDSAEAVSLYKPAPATTPTQSDSEGDTTASSSGDEKDEESLPEAAFAAFFSDVEHEVLPVTSGYRVTLTYNLYFGRTETESVTLEPTLNAVELMKTSLSALISDPDFLPKGGRIGFGLSYEYPFNDRTTLSSLKKHLKGIDSVLFQACEAVELSPALKAYYVSKYDDDQTACLLDYFADLDEQVESSLVEYLRHNERGKKVISVDPDDTSTQEYYRSRSIVWVRPPGRRNSFQKSYTAYGNEPIQEYAYGSICLVAKYTLEDSMDSDYYDD